MAAARRISVDLQSDGYSTADKLWKLFNQEQMETGGMARSLIKKGNFTLDYSLDSEGGKTPLMVSVDNNYLATVLNLLTFGADPNIKHKETGDTALHLAVDNGNISMVKLLLAFNANPIILNHQNTTPLNIAANLKQHFGGTPDVTTTIGTMFKTSSSGHNKRPIKKHVKEENIKGIIDVMMESIKLYGKTKEYFTKNSTVPVANNSSDPFLLSLDGGGMRALVSTLIMLNIEHRLQELTSTPQEMYTYFDYIAGTSSGGMVTCLLAYLESDANNAMAAMMRLIHIIKSPADKRGDEMDEAFRETFTKGRTMNDLNSDQRVILTASLAEHVPYELHLMTSYGEPRDGLAGPMERKVWEACRITATAPYFSPLLYELKLLDGGLVCNNPTLVGMTEIIKERKKEGKPAKIGCVVSIGTGIAPSELNDDIDFFSPSALSRLLHVSKSIHSLQSLVKHFVNHATASDGQEVIHARSLCWGLGCQYFRLTPSLKETVTMNTTDSIKLSDMLYTTQMYCLDNPELIDNVAKCLLSK